MVEREDAQKRADAEPVAEEQTPPTTPPAEDDAATTAADDAPPRGGCRTERRGWAGAHLHGAVRPRRRAAGRGRPPGRWC